MKSLHSVLLCLTGLALQSAQAELKLPAIFGDHMVLQSNGPVPFWGTANPNDSITVTAGTATATGTADAAGKWKVSLSGLKPNATAMDVTVADGAQTLTYHDVLVGDVWVCGGQSNMQMSVGSVTDSADVIAKATNPQMRLFMVGLKAALEPATDCRGQWVVCTPDTVPKFSAFGYFIGKEIMETQKIPVGLIGSNLGGTFAQAWTSLEGLQSDPDLKAKFADAFTTFKTNIDAIKAAHDQWQATTGVEYAPALAQWAKEAEVIRLTGKPAPPKPKPSVPEPPKPDDWSVPTVLFNGMINPIIPYGIKGVLWYQGESNGGDPLYHKNFPAMITDWRQHWGQGDFPFFWQQLPSNMARQSGPSPENFGWASARAAQAGGLKLPNTGMDVGIDMGDVSVVHFPNKADYAHRLALAIRHQVYGEDIISSGPTFDSFKVDGDKIHVTFANTGTGLKIGAPPKPIGGVPPLPTDHLVGFSIAGADGKFFWADAKIDDATTVTVSSASVPSPATVVYAWANNPEVNLYNSADLPAAPFRTDAVPAKP